MAVYSKLLYRDGGGILLSQQKEEQAKNKATILIGLGGTGVHCLRTIKTQVYTRLKPDTEGPNRSMYSHIRFVGVDSDCKSNEKTCREHSSGKSMNQMPLDDKEEFFTISFIPVPAPMLKTMEGFEWFDGEHIQMPNTPYTGARGVRQLGRVMLMNQSEAFIHKIENEINIAIGELESPCVEIHIISGLGGGTGSGCFLDVCYMIRSIVERIKEAVIFGYFFMPDVNLDKIPFESINVRNNIMNNGYAAMQELDYCMRLPENGGSFDQIYPNHRVIKWDRPPVDLCHLICAADAKGSVFPDGYNYAIETAAEYIMGFLSETGEMINHEHVAKFCSMIHSINENKKIGSEMAYCVIGASCVSIPLREINTYLASKVFEKFSTIRWNAPNEKDIESFILSVLYPGVPDWSCFYDLLFHELLGNALRNYDNYLGDWKFARDNGIDKFVQDYVEQTKVRMYEIESNVKRIFSIDEPKSFFRRLQARLSVILRDMQRGPFYAYSMIRNSEKKFGDVLNSLIDENIMRRKHEDYQASVYYDHYKKARADFERCSKPFGFSASKIFEYLLECVMLCEQCKLKKMVYDEIDSVLREFRNQLVEIAVPYYDKLNRVILTLNNTFSENRTAFADQKISLNEGNLVIPMISITEMKKYVDEEIAGMNIPNLFDTFMECLLNHEEEWIVEDEDKIFRLVSDFFSEVVSGNFSEKTMTSFLRDKYENKYGGIVTDVQLAEDIYNDWMKLLIEKASPLFCFDPNVWDEGKTLVETSIFVHPSSLPVMEAAREIRKTKSCYISKAKSITDRIVCITWGCGLPLCSYRYSADYEKALYSSKIPGTRLYEGENYSNGWNKLPSIFPQSMIKLTDAPQDIASLISEARTLYAEARKYGVIDDDSYICIPTSDSVDQFTGVLDELEQGIAKEKDCGCLEERIAKAQNLSLRLYKTSTVLTRDGEKWSNEIIQSVQEDYFVSAPVIQKQVREIVEMMDKLYARRKYLIEHANEKC